MLQISDPSSNSDNIEYHLRQAFIEGDRNYEAQFWYARQLYLNDKIQESHDRFQKLREAPTDTKLKNRIRGLIKSGQANREFAGSISRLEASYAFIRRDGPGDRIFLHAGDVSETVWQDFTVNMRVEFSIGFKFGGPAAVNVRKE